MPIKGWIASALLAVLCLGGITTLLSQAEFSVTPAGTKSPSRQTALDPGNDHSSDLGHVAPFVLRRGAEIQAAASEGEAEAGKRILKLR